MQATCPPRRRRGVGVMLALALGAFAGCTDNGAPTGAWLFGTVALLLVAAGAFALGRLLGRGELDALRREARREREAQDGLREAWFWRTDASHRVAQWLTPAGAAEPDWRLPEGADTLWQRFDDGQDGAGLRARMQAQQAFSGLRVLRRDDASPWLLRAVPRADDRGGFAGFSGSARPTGEYDARAADQAAFAALLQALDGAVLVLAGDGSPAGWRLRHANAEARRLLDCGEVAPGWGELQARLPAPLRNAVAESGPGSSAEHEGWRLRRFTSPVGEALLLVQRAAPDPDAAAGDSASFSFTVSHDLRAPVRVVEGFTRILKEDYGRQLDRVGNDHLDRVLGAAARMNLMIDALLTLAKLSQQPLARQPVNLSQLAAYIVDELRRGAPERTAEIEIEPGLQANGDPTLLRLVLENLLGNAWKYSARTKKTHIVFESELHEGRRAFVVRDNGAGFDMRGADRLFGLFQRLHSANDFPGTGVGLASVQRIVRRHGGEVWADAEPGRGAAFHFTLRE